MSCGPCNCDDCKVDRLEEDFEPPPIRLTWREVEPANDVQAKAWMGYLNQVYEQYPGKAIPMMTVISLVGQMIPGLRPENYEKVSLQIEKLIRESSEFELRKGKSGGLFKIASGTLPAPIPQVVAVTYADNYTCKGCGNTKLHDKNDKSCWSCGRKVGT